MKYSYCSQRKYLCQKKSTSRKYFFITASEGCNIYNMRNLGKYFKSQNNWFVISAGDRKSQAPLL